MFFQGSFPMESHRALLEWSQSGSGLPGSARKKEPGGLIPFYGDHDEEFDQGEGSINPAQPTPLRAASSDSTSGRVSSHGLPRALTRADRFVNSPALCLDGAQDQFMKDRR